MSDATNGPPPGESVPPPPPGQPAHPEPPRGEPSPPSPPQNPEAAPPYPGAAPPYGAPAPPYGAPGPQYGAPAPQYGAPAYPQPPAASSPYIAAPAYGAPPYGAPAAPKTNTLAIVSLVSSLVGVFLIPFLGSIVGIVTGHMSLSQIKRTGEGGHGLGLAGTIVGWVGLGLAIIGTIILVSWAFWFAANMPYYRSM